MLNIDLHDHESIRWKLRSIALEQRVTLRALVVRILTEWLDAQATGSAYAAVDSGESDDCGTDRVTTAPRRTAPHRQITAQKE
jgi:hypothetical protein